MLWLNQHLNKVDMLVFRHDETKIIIIIIIIECVCSYQYQLI